MNWRGFPPIREQGALLLIRAAAWLVPKAAREEWRREWIAELHFALHTLRERGEGARAEAKALGFARGAFHDAAWHRLCQWNREKLERAFAHGTQSPLFCLAALGALVLLIVITSGFAPGTRAVLMPLPYADAARIGTVTQGGTTMAVRSGIHRQWVEWWRQDSRLIDGAASYLWSERTVDHARTLRAKVSENFFSVLGAGDPFRGCRECAVLSYDFVHRHYGTNIPSSVMIDGRRFPVAGVLDRRFWFLTRRIGVWLTEEKADNRDLTTGVVLRMRLDASKRQVEAELESILRKRGINPWSSLIAISPIPERVRSVFGSFALALLLAVGTILPVLRPRMKALEGMASVRRAMFFCGKAALLLIAVLLAGIEFTRAASITMLGGTDLATEPVSTWLFLLGCMGALSWSIYDQRRRCRVCLRRYGLAAHIGCPGCILLSWSGTELVCLEGHGMLHVAERPACWQEPERWTSLDDSVLELFASK